MIDFHDYARLIYLHIHAILIEKTPFFQGRESEIPDYQSKLDAVRDLASYREVSRAIQQQIMTQERVIAENMYNNDFGGESHRLRYDNMGLHVAEVALGILGVYWGEQPSEYIQMLWMQLNMRLILRAPVPAQPGTTESPDRTEP